MKNAKKQIVLMLTIVLVFSLLNVPSTAASGTLDAATKPVQYTLSIDGGERVPLLAYDIGGKMFFKLRDLAMTLNGTGKQFEVVWDGSKNAVSLITGAAYTPTGGELSEPYYAAASVANLPSTIFYIDKRHIPIRSYTVNDAHYITLSDLASSLMFDFACDDEKHTVEINTRIYDTSLLSKQGNVQLPESGILLASLSDDNIFIYGVKNNVGLYDGLYLSISGINRFFKWQNISKDSFLPQLLLKDINRDGKNELIVILTADEGTGINLKYVHIINPENFTETDVIDPLDIISKNVDTSIVHESDTVTITITVNGQKSIVALSKNYAGGWAKDKAIFGNIITYEADGTKLKASVPVQVSYTVFVGEINITYAFDGNQYVMDAVEYIPYEL